MPVYCFKCRECGEKEQHTLSIADRDDPPDCRVCDGQLSRDLRAEHGTFRDAPGNWPLLSDAVGVHPDQIPEAMATAQKHGVPTEFTPDGRAILRDRAHRKKFCEAHGFYDRNAGYSDPQRRSR